MLAAMLSVMSAERHARHPEFPRGEAPALVDRTRLVDPYVLDLALLVRGEDHAERGAEVRRRKRAGVAVREHLRALAREAPPRARPACGCAPRPASIMSSASWSTSARSSSMPMSSLRSAKRLHALRAPEQVDRRGSRRHDLHHDLVHALQVDVDIVELGALGLAPQARRQARPPRRARVHRARRAS